jgi:hypothetical protein
VKPAAFRRNRAPVGGAARAGEFSGSDSFAPVPRPARFRRLARRPALAVWLACALGAHAESAHKDGEAALVAAGVLGTVNVLWEAKFTGIGGGENFPCVTRAGPWLYVPSTQNGKTWVVPAGREFRELAVNQACADGDQMVGPMLFAGDRLYVRTHQYLICLGPLDGAAK